jgi:hypothetical protein
MLAPLGGIGVVAPVPHTGSGFPRVACGRGPSASATRPAHSGLPDAPTFTQMRRAARFELAPAALPNPSR